MVADRADERTQDHERRRRPGHGGMVLRGTHVERDRRRGRRRIRARQRRAKASGEGAIPQALGAVHSSGCMRRMSRDDVLWRAWDGSQSCGVFHA
jgi:hypothetical protein